MMETRLLKVAALATDDSAESDYHNAFHVGAGIHCHVVKLQTRSRVYTPHADGTDPIVNWSPWTDVPVMDEEPFRDQDMEPEIAPPLQGKEYDKYIDDLNNGFRDSISFGLMTVNDWEGDNIWLYMSDRKINQKISRAEVDRVLCALYMEHANPAAYIDPDLSKVTGGGEKMNNNTPVANPPVGRPIDLNFTDEGSGD